MCVWHNGMYACSLHTAFSLSEIFSLSLSLSSLTHTYTLSLPFLPSPSSPLSIKPQINKRCKQQDRAIVVTDTNIFKLDPRKHFQRKKSPLSLATVEGVSISTSHDQAFIVHFQGGKDLLFYMVTAQNENRVAELVAVLCQICQRFVCPILLSLFLLFLSPGTISLVPTLSLASPLSLPLTLTSLPLLSLSLFLLFLSPGTIYLVPTLPYLPTLSFPPTLSSLSLSLCLSSLPLSLPCMSTIIQVVGDVDN